ncbi:caspase domain protein [Ostertagia ostertagi]
MGGENKMLIIGINNVDGVVFKKLTNARSDAMRVQGILSSQYSFVDADGSALLDENATRENIMRALHELVNQGFKDDNVVIYYAGHGYQNPKSMAGYLIPFDAYKIPGNRIPFKEVLDIVKEIEAKHVLLIADCCYSGCFITRNRTASGLRAHTVLEKLDSRWVLVSGGEEPVSDGQEGKGSPFANLLCDILGQNKETTLAASQIFEWVIVNMATGYPIPKAAEINCSGHKDGEMIFHLNETNIEKYETPVAKPSFIRPGIKLPGYYLSRTVTFYDDQHEQKTFFSQKVQGDKVLVDLLTTEKRIVILGGAGSGKSIELRNLEKLLDETTAMVPVYQRFNTYSKQDIEDFLPEGYKQVLPSSLVVLLDGFDEIQPENVVDAIRKINRFAEVRCPGLS